MFACVPSAAGERELRVRLAPSALLVFPDVETLNVGFERQVLAVRRLKRRRDRHGRLTAGLEGPPRAGDVFEIAIGLQLVGLSMNFACRCRRGFRGRGRRSRR